MDIRNGASVPSTNQQFIVTGFLVTELVMLECTNGFRIQMRLFKSNFQNIPMKNPWTKFRRNFNGNMFYSNC